MAEGEGKNYGGICVFCSRLCGVFAAICKLLYLYVHILSTFIESQYIFSVVLELSYQGRPLLLGPATLGAWQLV